MTRSVNQEDRYGTASIWFHAAREENSLLGVSDFDVPDLEAVQKIAGEGSLVCNQVLYHLRERAIEHAVIPWCEKDGVAVVAYSPFGHDDNIEVMSGC